MLEYLMTCRKWLGRPQIIPKGWPYQSEGQDLASLRAFAALVTRFPRTSTHYSASLRSATIERVLRIENALSTETCSHVLSVAPRQITDKLGVA